MGGTPWRGPKKGKEFKSWEEGKIMLGWGGWGSGRT